MQATQWQVLIQGRVLRTLQLNDLVLPSEGLALAIAAEFGRQGEQINPTGTPLVRFYLCSPAEAATRAIDVT